MITKIENAVIVSEELIHGKNIYIKDGKILAVTEEKMPFGNVIDAKGAYASAGFIDIHTHGAGDYDFADGTLEDIMKAAYAHAKHGTTTVYPTCTSASFEDTANFIKNVKTAMDKNEPGKPYIAGSHLEGPYFSDAMRGAQNPEYIKCPKPEEYKYFVELGEGSVRRISFAPELDGALELCKYLKNEGIVASFGHTDGVYKDIKPAIDLGCTLATHLYSGMNTVVRRELRRHLGAVETSFLEDEVTVEVIADGIHLPPELLKLIYKIKGADKVCLVTDSMRGAGMGEGMSVLGPRADGMDCVIRNGVAYLTDMTGFAGSVATTDRLVRVMNKEVGLPLCECVKMMTKTPAKVMGLRDRGEIKEGYAADVVVFDENIEIKKVICGGKELA